MHNRLSYITDRIATDLKHVSKRIYRNPVIRAGDIRRTMTKGGHFIGITGSSGKTTTKDLAEMVLSSQFQTQKNSDTNNSLYSIANTLLRSPFRAEVYIQEVGASEHEDLNRLAQLLRPTIGVVTNIGNEHYKAFRSREAVSREKTKLIAALPVEGVAILNADDELVSAMTKSAKCRVIMFGRGEMCDLRASQVRSEWPQRLQMTLTYQDQSVVCYTQLCGEHFVYCVLAAVGIGLACGMTLEQAVMPIRSFCPVTGRMSPHETPSGITIIRDDWKAPYWSIAAPIAFLSKAQAKRKIAIFGTISDYASKGSKAYLRVCQSALECADHVIFVGPNAHRALRIKQLSEGKTVEAFFSAKELADHLRTFLHPGDLVLLKGSGGDHLARLALMYERDVKCWRKRCGRETLCDNCRLLSVP